LPAFFPAAFRATFFAGRERDGGALVLERADVFERDFLAMRSSSGEAWCTTKTRRPVVNPLRFRGHARKT
jgi:hypothetical protein